MFGWNIWNDHQCDLIFEHISAAHLGEELDHWWFVWVLLAELEGQLEGAILKIRKWGTTINISCINLKRCLMWSKDNGVPQHDVVLPRSSRHPRWRILLSGFLFDIQIFWRGIQISFRVIDFFWQVFEGAEDDSGHLEPLEVPHQPPPRCRRHLGLCSCPQNSLDFKY